MTMIVCASLERIEISDGVTIGGAGIRDVLDWGRMGRCCIQIYDIFAEIQKPKAWPIVSVVCSWLFVVLKDEKVGR